MEDNEDCKEEDMQGGRVKGKGVVDTLNMMMGNEDRKERGIGADADDLGWIV